MASKRAIRRKGCAHKKCYASGHEAEGAAFFVNANYVQNVNAYRCIVPSCRCWHIGRTGKANRGR